MAGEGDAAGLPPPAVPHLLPRACLVSSLTTASASPRMMAPRDQEGWDHVSPGPSTPSFCVVTGMQWVLNNDSLDQGKNNWVLESGGLDWSTALQAASWRPSRKPPSLSEPQFPACTEDTFRVLQRMGRVQGRGGSCPCKLERALSKESLSRALCC